MHRLRVTMMLVGSTLVVPAIWQPARAQGAAAPAQDPTPAAAEAAPEGALQEVVVTAQKEKQSLQKASAAITSVDRMTLIDAGVSNLSSVQNLVPAVRFQQEAASTEVYIRGVGSTLDFPMIEPPTAFNINGVYIPREVSSATLFDLQGVEVLPGPQGTLYGRGALGGAVNANVAPPGTGNSGVLLEAGNYSMLHASAASDFVVNDKITLRGAVNSLYHDGYLESGADSAKDVGGRLSAVIQPTDTLSVYVWSQYETRRGNAENVLSKGSFTDPKAQRYPHPDNPWDDTQNGPLASHLYPPFGPISAYPSNWRASLNGAQVDWDLGSSTLTYIPSYINLNWHQGYWLTEKPAVFNERIDQQTHELRWSGHAGALRWLTGVYAYRLHTDGQLFIDFPPEALGPGLPALWLDASDVRDHVLKGGAAFGQLTYSLTDDLRLIAGGRFSSDRRTANGYVPTVVVGPSPGVAPQVAGPTANPLTCVFGPCATFDNRKTWSRGDWKAGAEYDLTPHSMLYATAQTAFQPGTFDNFPNTVTEPSTLLSFAAGSKNTFADGRLRVNNEAFYYIYKNLLTQAFDSSTGQQRLHTAQRVKIYGDQLDLSWLVETNTTFTTSVAYTHARFDEFSFLDSAGTLQSYDGNQLQNAPDWSVNLDLRHRFPLSSGAVIEAAASTHIESAFWGDFSHSPGLYQAAYAKADASLAYHAASGKWTLALWGKNLSNRAVQGAAAAGGPLDPGPGSYIPEPPRTFGVRYNWSID